MTPVDALHAKGTQRRRAGSGDTHMSYDLAVWEGDRPPTDTEALDMFEHLYDGIR